MIDTLYQCCYTNDGGWDTVAVSDNIPKAAYDTCSRFQNVNSSIPSEGYKDETGNDLNLFEIHSDEEFVYVCRTKFGLVDKVGRNNMFAHAYILPWKESGALADPNRFLGLRPENFATSKEEAGKKREASYYEPYTVSSAFAASQLTPEAYVTLIRCVYANGVDEKVPEPVFVQYDGSEEQMRAILYCLYAGLPYYLRRRLRVANGVTKAPERFSIILSRDAKSHKKYFIPQTGETNALKEKSINKIERYGYIDFAPKHLSKQQEKDSFFTDFFDKLESSAMQLGDMTASNEITLKIAYQLMTEKDDKKLSDEEVLDRMTDALFSKSNGSARMDDYIAEMLSIVVKRRISLSSQLETLLELRLKSGCTQDLVEVADTYYAWQMQNMDALAAAEKLQKLPESMLERYIDNLKQSDGGKKVLDAYFQQLLENGVSDWTSLNAVLEKAKARGLGSRYNDPIEKRAWEMYMAAIEQEDSNRVEELTQYANIMGQILNESALLECLENAKEQYWNGVTFSNFTGNDRSIYQVMMCSARRCSMFAQFSRILKCKMLDNGDVHDYFDLMDEFFSDYGEDLSEKEVREAVDTVVDKLQGQYPDLKRREPRIKTWSSVVAQIGRSPLRGRIIRAIHENIFDLRRHVPATFAADYMRLNDNLRQFYQDFEKVAGKSDELVDAAKTLFTLVMDECVDCDTSDYPIGLDTWLILGGCRYGQSRCFDVFDVVKPQILFADPASVIADSECMGSTKCIAYGDSYVANRGSEAKTVKKWIAAKAKLEKGGKRDGGILGFAKGLGRRDVAMEDIPSQNAAKIRQEMASDFVWDVPEKKAKIEEELEFPEIKKPVMSAPDPSNRDENGNPRPSAPDTYRDVPEQEYRPLKKRINIFGKK